MVDNYVFNKYCVRHPQLIERECQCFCISCGILHHPNPVSPHHNKAHNMQVTMFYREMLLLMKLMKLLYNNRSNII